MHWEESDLDVELSGDHPVPDEILSALERLRAEDVLLESVTLNRKRLDSSGKVGRSYEKFARLVEIHDRDDDDIAAAVVAAAMEADIRDGARSTGRFQIKIAYREQEGVPLDSTTACFGLADAGGGKRPSVRPTSQGDDLARKLISALERALAEAQRTIRDQAAKIVELQREHARRLDERDSWWDKRAARADEERKELSRAMLGFSESAMKPSTEFVDLSISIASAGLSMMESVQREKIGLAEQTAEDAKAERRHDLADKALSAGLKTVNTLLAAKFGVGLADLGSGKKKKKKTKSENEEGDVTKKKNPKPAEPDAGAESDTIDHEVARRFDPDAVKLLGLLFDAIEDDDWEQISDVYGDDTRERLEEIRDDRNSWTFATIKSFVDEEITCDFEEGPDFVKRLMDLQGRLSDETGAVLSRIVMLQQRYENAVAEAVSD